jgi:hypothetical protein
LDPLAFCKKRLKMSCYNTISFTSIETAPKMEPWSEVYQQQKKRSLLTYWGLNITGIGGGM